MEMTSNLGVAAAVDWAGAAALVRAAIAAAMSRSLLGIFFRAWGRRVDE